MWITITVCVRILLVLILVPAVNSKLWQVHRVGNAIVKWRIVPSGLAMPLARATVLSELFVLLTVSTRIRHDVRIWDKACA